MLHNSLKALAACRVGEGPGDGAVESMADARSPCQQQLLPCSSHVVSCLVTCSVTSPAAAERPLPNGVEARAGSGYSISINPNIACNLSSTSININSFQF